MFCLKAHPTRLPLLLSGACDGEVRIWNLTNRTCLYSSMLHRFVRLFAPWPVPLPWSKPRLHSRSARLAAHDALPHVLALASLFCRGFVRGIALTPAGDQFISVGQDKTIKIAKLVRGSALPVPAVCYRTVPCPAHLTLACP